MRNLKLEIEYEGTKYCGWQTQAHRKPHATSSKSLQETIEKALQRILQEKVSLVASGRTDAGVHALRQIAHGRVSSALSLDKLQRALNSLLAPDIAIRSIEEGRESFHARFDAASKIYRYLILNGSVPSVFLKKFTFHVSFPLNVRRMRQEALALVGRHNFKSFCASGSSAKSMVRTIKRITVKSFKHFLLAKDSRLIMIEIEADGFLYNMVRAIAGTLIQAGAQKLKRGDVKRILLAKDRSLAGPTASAKGLFLIEVQY